MFSLSPQSSHTSIRCSPAASLTSWPSILHNHGNTQIRTWSMERRRCLEFHIQARSSQPAFQIKADEMTTPVTLCVLVREIETKAHSKHNLSSKTKMIVIIFFSFWRKWMQWQLNFSSWPLPHSTWSPVYWEDYFGIQALASIILRPLLSLILLNPLPSPLSNAH